MFKHKVAQISEPGLKAVMTLLLRVYAIERILEKPQALYAGGLVTSGQFKTLRTQAKE